MNLVHAILYGIVEGVTEFLPVSSTGHLILLSRLLHASQTDFLKTFEIAIQVGAIFAAVVLYVKRLLTNMHLLYKVIAAFIPTALVGLLVYGFVKTYLLGNVAIVVWALFLGGVILVLFEWWYAKRGVRSVAHAVGLEELSYGQAVLVGLVQTLAFVPGVSRSAATIVGGMLMGLRRDAIVEFSFMLAIPTMLAATGLDVLKTGWHFSVGEWSALLVGGAVSFFVALLAIRWLLRFVRTNTFVGFGVYRIVLAAVFWLFVL